MSKRYVFLLCLGLVLCHTDYAQSRLRELLESKVGHETEKNKQKDIDKPLALISVEYSPSDYIPIKSSEGLWGYKYFNAVAVKPKYQEAGPFMEGLAPVKLGGKYGYIDKDGKCVIPYKYESAGVFSEGLARVSMNGKYGYIDRNGKQVIPYKFSDAGDFIDGLAEVIFNESRSFVDKVGEMFNDRSEVMQSFSSFARQYVEGYVNDWQKKGKYEKTVAWQKRVNEKTRAALVDSLLEVAKANYIEFQKGSIKQDFRLGDYDADGEIFLVHDARFGSLLLPVPIDEAMDFEMAFTSVIRHDTYCVAGDGIGLSSAEFVTPSGRSYKYCNTDELEFASVDIEYNFDRIEVDSDYDGVSRVNQQMKKKSITIGKSDVDLSIPESHLVNSNTFAVIIANENYQRVSHVEFAANDGNTFKEYCSKTLGLPEKNIRLVQDATLVNMWEQVDWLTDIAKAYNGDAKIIFYYAGHGIPDESSKDAYLLPVDGNGSNVSTGYKLSSLYARLAENPTKSTLVLLDACFSGAERSGEMMVAARGVAIKAKPAAPKGNMIVISAAQGDETAYPYKEKGHGLFTYFLCKKLQDTGGKVTLGDLSSYITENVSKHSIIENSKSQTPTVNVSGSIVEDWRSMTF